MNNLIISASLALALGSATVAVAKADKPPATGPRACLLTDVSPKALACTGFFAGNLLSSSTVTQQQSALGKLGFAWNGNFTTVSKINSLGGGTVVDFGNADSNPVDTLFGDTFVGLHFGGGGKTGVGESATAFFKIDAGTTGLSFFQLNIPTGSSGAVLYRTGSASGGGIEEGGGMGAVVPEPQTWALMIAGFGLVGASMRRRSSAVVA